MDVAAAVREQDGNGEGEEGADVVVRERRG
jgi:hypothetical protein